MVKVAKGLTLVGLLACAWAGYAYSVRVSTPSAIPAITLTGTLLSAQNRIAFIIGPDGITEHIYRVEECLPRIADNPARNCSPDQARLVEIQQDGIIVEMGGRRVRVRIGRGPKAAPEERYLTRQDVVENVCGNFAGTACEEIGMIEAGKAKPVQFIIYPMCFEVFVRDWRREGPECLMQAMYILNNVAYVEFF